MLIAHVLNVNQAKLGEYGHLVRLYVCNNLECVVPRCFVLEEVNLDQNIVLTGADELKIFKSLRVYLCLVESVYCLERWNALL